MKYSSKFGSYGVFFVLMMIPRHEVRTLACDTNTVDSDYIKSKSVKTKQYKNLLNEIRIIKENCGELCETVDIDRSAVLQSGKLYHRIDKTPNCNSLWNTSIFDIERNFNEPLQRLPKYLLKYFTHNGKVEILSHYLDGTNSENHTTNAWAWTSEGMEWHRQLLEENKLTGSYGLNVVQRIQKILHRYIVPKDKNILVIGSTRPWIESILLSQGAKHITTLEYNPYLSDHPRITTISPDEFFQLVLSKKAPIFDAMVTFSSIEHSGLGRYGDHLNPWGDIIAMGRAWCQVKPGGRALVGIPGGNDAICFNAARRYGPFLYSQLFANWKQIFCETNGMSPNYKQKDDCYDTQQTGYQPIFILEK